MVSTRSQTRCRAQPMAPPRLAAVSSGGSGRGSLAPGSEAMPSPTHTTISSHSNDSHRSSESSYSSNSMHPGGYGYAHAIRTFPELVRSRIAYSPSPSLGSSCCEDRTTVHATAVLTAADLFDHQPPQHHHLRSSPSDMSSTTSSTDDFSSTSHRQHLLWPSQIYSTSSATAAPFQQRRHHPYQYLSATHRRSLAARHAQAGPTTMMRKGKRAASSASSAGSPNPAGRSGKGVLPPGGGASDARVPPHRGNTPLKPCRRETAGERFPMRDDEALIIYREALESALRKQE